MKIHEKVYIQSNQLSLIKQFIDYSIMHSNYQLKGISMSDTISIEDIIKNEVSVLIIEEKVLKGNVKIEMTNLKEQNIDDKLAIIYLCNEIDYDVIQILNEFIYHKICVKNDNFFDILSLLFIISNERSHNGPYDHIIRLHLQTLHIKENLYGFYYLKKAISYQIEKSNIKMAQLCDKIAREYHVTSSRVERCMRTAIDGSYKKHKNVYKYLYGFDEKPGCMHLICKISEEIMQK